MNGLVKAALRVGSCARGVVLAAGASRPPVKRALTRTYWHVSGGTRAGISGQHSRSAGLLALHDHSNVCGCGCGLKAIHTKADKDSDVLKTQSPEKPGLIGERELVEFLTEEIVAERKAQKAKSLPAELDGFTIKVEGAEVVLTKAGKDETVNITWNVNHTVDSDEGLEGDAPSSEKQEEFAEMRSKPQFEVDVVRGDATLGFTCSFLQDQVQQDGEEYNDIFGIDEITLYKGEWNDKVYCVAGDVLDGYLYDLLMNLLEEKGVGNEFVQKLSDLSTNYEHNAYINFLEGVSKFTIGK